MSLRWHCTARQRMTLSGVLYGHGHMGRLHAEKLRARSDVRLAIVDPDQGFNDP